MASPSAPPPSRMLGRYAMYEAFAQGGMAALHYGRLLGPSGFSRTVAVKRLHVHLSDDPSFVAMFLDEARLAARIHHPNVVQTLDVESSEGEIFVVLDYVHGESLSRILREAQRIGASVSPAIVGAILFGALEGLHAAHEALDAKGEPLEIVHRDVSPHNILVGTDGIARVIDFGVAKARGRAQTTRGGQLKGKLSYMAPEQLRGKVTRRTDVFAASVVLWEALTARRLFEGDDDGDLIDKVLEGAIPSPRRYAPHVTHELEAIVLRGLERDPSRRFATARDMALALEGRMALATPIEVGAFVERIGGATLAQRAGRVAQIERESSDADGDDAAGVRDAPASLAPRRPAVSLTGVATAPIPALARQEPPARPGVADESVGTGMATVSEQHASRRRSLVGVVSVASLGGVAVGLVLALAFTIRGGHSPDASAGAPAQVPSVASVVPPSPAVLADAAPAGDAVEGRPPAAEPALKRTAAPRPHPRADCSPPYTIDVRGLRHYKPECI